MLSLERRSSPCDPCPPVVGAHGLWRIIDESRDAIDTAWAISDLFEIFAPKRPFNLSAVQRSPLCPRPGCSGHPFPACPFIGRTKTRSTDDDCKALLVGRPVDALKEWLDPSDVSTHGLRVAT
jgi:hypothetical protein